MGSLVPYDRNPRKNDHVVVKMMAAITEFGFRIPILARSDGEVIDGHLRLKAALRLNLATVPVILCDDWTEAQVKAFRLLANRSAMWADWDMDLLKEELFELDGLGFDLAMTGFESSEIDNIFNLPGPADEDAVPAVPYVPVSRPGDLWLLGEHRLLCGDATVSTDVDRLLAGAKPNLMVTDPPYGVPYDPHWRKVAGLNNSNRMGKVDNDARADWYDAWVLFQGAVAYVWHGGRFAGIVQDSLERAHFLIRAQIIWAKHSLVISRGHYHWQHEPCWFAVKDGAEDGAAPLDEMHDPLGTLQPFDELYPDGHSPCWYAVREGATAAWKGNRKHSTLWKIERAGGDAAANVHGTQKPVGCMRRPMLNHTRRGDAVYEPFSGSGTTIIAAETSGRRCLAMELNPQYTDVAVKRWQDFTGRAATLEGDGRIFAQVNR